jgi:ubiquinone/menaquinone biosynthesis C-methylase UbiE
MTRRLDCPISTQGDVSMGALSGERSKLVSGDSIQSGSSFATVPPLPMTGERIHPGMAGEQVFREHEARYVFASKFVQGKKVLDVACGIGIGTECLLKGGAQTCVGLDIDPFAVAYARAAYGNCVFARCDATSLCLADDAVDVVVSFETIEHLRDHASFLRECKRVLRPGGILICSTPNQTLSRWGEPNPFHLQEFELEEFNCLLGQFFTAVKLYSQSNQFLPLYVGRKLLLKFLERLELAEPVRRLIRRKPATVTQRAEFGRTNDELNGEIQLRRASRVCQPMFFVAVARKSLS